MAKRGVGGDAPLPPAEAARQEEVVMATISEFLSLCTRHGVTARVGMTHPPIRRATTAYMVAAVTAGQQQAAIQEACKAPRTDAVTPHTTGSSAAAAAAAAAASAPPAPSSAAAAAAAAAAGGAYAVSIGSVRATGSMVNYF